MLTSDILYLLVLGSARRRSKTTRMLVTISFTYVVTTLPQLVLTITVYALYRKYGSNTDREWFLQILPWLDVMQVITEPFIICLE